MAKQTTPIPAAPSRVERTLAYMIAAIIGLSIIAIVVVLIAGPGQADGIWPIIFVLPIVGLPIGFVLIIVLLVLSTVRRGRADRDAGK